MAPCLSEGSVVHLLLQTIELCWRTVHGRKMKVMGRDSWPAETVYRSDCMACLFNAFSSIFLYLVPRTSICEMLWQRACSPRMGCKGLTTSHEVINARARAPRAKHGPLETQERQPTRILAVAEPLSRAPLFFHGLSVLFFNVHSISPLNQIRLLINTSQDLLWSFQMRQLCWVR